MPDSPNLAARLLPFAPTAEVADALLTDAELADDPIEMGHAPTRGVGVAVARRGVKYAATVAAGPVEDPALLSLLGRMPQKTVRRLVAAKPDTPREVLDALLKWALKETDEETLDALAGTLPPPEYLPVLARRRTSEDTSAERGYYGGYRGASLPVAAIVDNLARRGDAAMTWETFALNLPTLRRGIVAAAGSGRIPIPPAMLVRARPYDEQASLLDALMEDRDVVLDADVTELLVARLRDDEELPAAYRQRARYARTLSPEVGARFVHSGVGELAESFARTLADDRVTADDALFDALTRTVDSQAAGVLLRNWKLCDRLSDEQLARLAPHVTEASASETALKRRGGELAADVVTDLLRGGDISLTTKWIAGELPAAPTAAQLAALVDRPGTSLVKAPSGVGISGVISGPRLEVPTTVSEYVGRFIGHFTLKHLANPGVLDVLDGGGPATLRYAATGKPAMGVNVACVYLGARCAEAFGGFAPAWTTAAKLAADIEVGTISDFLSLVTVMVDMPVDVPEAEEITVPSESGALESPTDAPAPALATPADTCEQLLLL